MQKNQPPRGRRLRPLSAKLLLFMKLTTVLLVVGFLQVSATGLSQDTKVSLRMKNASIAEVLQEIGKKTPYRFAFNNNTLPAGKEINLNVKQQPVSAVLDEVLANTGLHYQLLDEQLIVVSAYSKNQQTRISGKVTDQTGTPLLGVSIRVKHTNTGTVTNEYGRFSLVVPNNAVLIVSYVGFQQQEVNLNGRREINIVLDGIRELESVVVVGYGVQQKSTLTGSVGVVGSKVLTQSPAINASDALIGRVPGLMAIKGSGGPGSSSKLYVRGISGLGSEIGGTTSGRTLDNLDPLTVIDGIPGRKLDDLDPNEIESISVLKDASAVAVYGARGANGVILVTTKKGSKGKTTLNFTSNTTMQRPTRLYKVLDSYNYAMLQNEAYKNEGNYNPAAGRGYTDAELTKFKDGSDPDRYANTDWYNEMLSAYAMQTQYNLSASGGNDKTTFFVSAGYASEGGLFDVVKYSRYNARVNVESQLTKRLTLNVQTAANLSKKRDIATFDADYVIKYALQSPRILPNQFSNGLYNQIPSARGNMYLVSRGANGTYNNTGNMFNGNMSLQYEVPYIKGLFVKGMVGYDKTSAIGKTFSTPYETYILDANGNYTKSTTANTKARLSQTYNDMQLLTAEMSASYKRNWNKHHVNGLLLYNMTDMRTDAMGAVRSNFQSASLPELSLGDPTQASNSGTETQRGRMALVGRFGYDFDSRYMFEFNFRYDGSNIFPKGKQFGFFPSVALGWRISEEQFFRDNIKLINNLKVRGSYGLAGNDGVNPYQFLSTYDVLQGADGGYSFGGANPQYIPGLKESVLSNPSFTWEKARMLNLGLEMGILKNRLTLEADYFRKNTTDILMPRTAIVGAPLGIPLPSENMAQTLSYGVEVQLGYNGQAGKVNYFVRPNLTWMKNKIVRYDQASSVPAWQRLEGKRISLGRPTIGYVADGLYQSEEEIKNGPKPLYDNVKPGDIRYVDIDGDGKITPNDMQLINKGSYPDVIYGLYTGAGYKGIELNILVQGAADVQTLFTGTTAFPFAADGVPVAHHLDRWTPENPNAAFPRMWINNQNNSQTSTYWLRNTAYVRVKNVELSYTLPRNWMKAAGMSNVKVYVSGMNLLTFSAYKYADPEASGAVAYPLMRFYNAGINVQF